MHKIELDKVFNFDLAGTFSFGSLTVEQLEDIYKDGRCASHLLERQLVSWFPELKHVKGCKGYDHINTFDESVSYDAKNFTKASGCGFAPSGHYGKGRKFDEEKFLFKAHSLIYIICDIIDFPKIGVVFKDGKELSKQYPKGNISLSKRGELFSEFKISA